MKLAVVGVTGMVGQEILKVLKESDIEIDEFIPVASEQSIGKELVFDNKEYSITSIQNAIDKKPDIAIFSAGGNTSLEWAEKFAEVDTTVIDNSSAWRMDENKLCTGFNLDSYCLSLPNP